MAAVLGVSGLYHDAAAVLVIDGKVVVAIQEERLSRIKHDAGLPWRAMAACLGHAEITSDELAAVVFYEQPFVKLERVLLTIVRQFPRSFGSFVRGMRAQLTDKLWVLDTLADGLGIERKRVRAIEHHHSHAASAYYLSGYENAAVLTLDGVGEWDTTTIWHGVGDTLSKRQAWRHPHSLGLFYAALTAYLGFEVLEGEYKVMGLAAFGKPRHCEQLRKVLRISADGFTLEPSFFDVSGDTQLGFTPRLEKLLGPRRPPGQPWNLAANDSDRHYADIAASVQSLLEEAVLVLARRAHALTGASSLCLAGGVALNVTANARIVAETEFTRLFVQPAAGDAGGALGAAVVGALQEGDPRTPAMVTAAWGLPIDAAAAAALADAMGLKYQRVGDPAAAAAAELNRGSLLAYAQGRFEWGPRALGQRSLLAPPFDASVRDKINRVVKKREPFRPFAPTIVAENFSDYFEGTPDDMTRFMTTVRRAKPHTVERLAAVVHVDHTARVHSVHRGNEDDDVARSGVEDSGISRDGEGLREVLGLVPEGVLLNTSLNGAGEPIVATAADALAFLNAHPVDALLVEDVLIKKRCK